MKDTNCPYCNAEIDINHDDGAGYAEDEVHQQECQECLKTFVFTTSISFSYQPEKADCLNEGGTHLYKPSRTAPVCFTEMECRVCDDRRPLTEPERKKYNIPTLEEYRQEMLKKRELKQKAST